jgi:polyisoprenoid-binding protein YceI
LLRWLWLAAVAACSTAFANEECYSADGTSGTVTFHVLQSGAPFTGSFRRFDGVACFEQGRLTRIDASLDPASVDSGLPELDAALMKNDFFDVGEFPRVTFASTSVQVQGDAQLTRGTLEIKGNRRDVAVALHTQQQGGKMVISGTLTLDRLQYGIGMGEWTNTKWLGAEIQLDINATMTRKQ